jgi:hypothetical protein
MEYLLFHYTRTVPAKRLCVRVSNTVYGKPHVYNKRKHIVCLAWRDRTVPVPGRDFRRSAAERETITVA